MTTEAQTSLADLIAARFGEPSETGAERPAEGELARQLAHRSHRRWADRPVARATLDLLYAATLSVPTKSDLMQYAIIEVADEDNKQAIARMIPEMPWIADAPVLLVFCGDGRRMRRICELRGTTFSHDPVDAFFNAGVDAALALSAMIRAAESEGLVGCPISAVREPIAEISELLGLPDRVFPVAGLCLGYPDWEPWVSLRLPPSLMVHRDRYDDSQLEAEIEAYDRRRAEANPIRRQRDIKRYGELANYGWSADKSRQVSHTERAAFGELIRRTYGI